MLMMDGKCQISGAPFSDEKQENEPLSFFRGNIAYIPKSKHCYLKVLSKAVLVIIELDDESNKMSNVLDTLFKKTLKHQ